jgi:hypothetical protein
MVLQLGELAKTSSEIIRSEGPPKHHYPSNGRATGLLCRKLSISTPPLVRRFDIAPGKKVTKLCTLHGLVAGILIYGKAVLCCARF